MADTMGIAICSRPCFIELQKRPVPEITDDQVLVRVSLCGICGTDLAAWRGEGKGFPHSPGHEYCGTVERAGSKVEGLSGGQRVAINPNLGCGECAYCRSSRPNLCEFLKNRRLKSNGGFSEYVALDFRMAHPIPPTLSDEAATLIEPLSCALHTVELADITAGDAVVLFGGGIQGILSGLIVQSIGGKILFVEPMAHRREQIAGLFDAAVLSPGELSGSPWEGRADCAIDCSGSAEAAAQAVVVLRKGGILVLAGLVRGGEAELPLDRVTKGELQIRGAWLNPDTFAGAIETAVRYQSFLQRLETKTFILSEVQSAFECAEERHFNRILIRS